MKSSKKRPRARVRSRLNPDLLRLECRQLLAQTQPSFAATIGNLARGGIGFVDLRLLPRDFRLPRGEVLLDLSISGAATSLLGSRQGVNGKFHWFRGGSGSGRPAEVITTVEPGALRIFVGAPATTSGKFQVHVGLVGDLDGNYRVDRKDLALIRASIGQRVGQPGYSEAADVNHDGKVGLRDLLLAGRNFAVTTSVRPLGVTLGLSPDTPVDPLGRVSGPNATLTGQTQPRAKVFLDQDIDGRVDAETTSDAAGRYQFNVALKPGPNGLLVKAIGSLRQVSEVSTVIVRRDGSTDASPPTLLLDGPPPASLTNQLPTLTGHAADLDSGLESVTVQVDGGPITALNFDVSTGAFSFTPSGLADGPHILRFNAWDRAGNTSTPVSVGFTLDTTPPAINNFALSAGSRSAPGETASSRVVLIGQADPNTRLTLQETGATTAANNLGAFQFTDVPAALGLNTFHLVTAPDDAGNTATVSTSFTRKSATASGDSVVYWNNVTLNAIVADNSSPPVAARNLAIVMGSVYDAVNAAQGQSGYFVTIAAPGGASLPAAVAGAAQEALRWLYPAQADAFTAALNAGLAEVPNDQARDAGLALGRQVAEAIHSQRVNDGSTAYTLDEGSEIAGKWRPTLPNFDPGLKPAWGDVTPFALADVNQFATPGPPDLSGSAYADAFNQVKQLGRIDSTTRTADETQIARFWADGVGTVTPVGHWNQIAQAVAGSESNSLDANARLFAMLNIALADSAISTWHVKYQDDLWRPITAIAQADLDGNDATTADPTWRPLLPTPAFPSYVSGHSTFSSAAAAVLGSVFGDSYAFSTASPGLTGVTRHYAGFTQAADEAGMSRIYGGIHYLFDDVDGLELGKNIGMFVVQTFDRRDTAAPRISVTSPTPGGVLGANTTVTGTVNDSVSGVASFIVKIDGGSPQPVAFDPLTGAFQLPTTFGTDGTHTLRFVATDHAGNTSAPLDLQLTLDRVVPTIQLDSVSNQGSIDSTTRLTGIADPTGSRLVKLTYRVDSGPMRPIGFDPATGAFDESIAWGALAAGGHTLTLDAMDAGGNTAHSAFNVNLAAATPFTLSSVQPAGGSVEVGVTFRPRIVFSRPVDSTTLSAQNFYLSFGGQKLPATIVPAADGSYAWLFPTVAMPGGATITLTVDGSSIRTREGLVLDADGDGIEGGKLTSLFTTVSTSGVPGTSIVGLIADPGIDLHPMTRDDIRAGADGLLNTADDLYLNPLAGVTLYVLGQEDRKITTDAQGHFQLNDVPAGDVKLVIDGRTASNAPADFYFPEMVMDLTIQPGVVNTVMGSMGDPVKAAALTSVPGVYLPRLETALLHTVSNASGMSITVDPASAPNLTPEQQEHLHLDIPAGALIGADGLPLASARIGISTVPTEMVRDMLPAGILQHTFDITIQAIGVATFATPVALTVPNVYGAAPGSKLNLLSFDHTTGRLVIDGTMTVSADGLSATTDPGSGIIHPGWHGPDLGTATEPCLPDEGGGSGPDAIVGNTTKDTLKSHFYIKDDESFTLKFKNEQADRNGKRLEVEVKVDGPYGDFLEGLDDLADKPFSLCPQDEKSFKISVKKLLDKIKDYNKDQFFGAKFHVIAKSEGNPAPLLDEEFFVYRLLDVADDNHNDGKPIQYVAHINFPPGIPLSQEQAQAGPDNTLEFAPTITGIKRDREVEMRMPDDAKPKLEFTDDAFSEENGTFSFKPTDSLGNGETASKKGKLVVKDPKKDKEIGRVDLLGQANGKYKIAVNLAGLEATLLQLANDWKATRNSNAKTPVRDELLLESEINLFDTPGKAQAMAEQVYAKIQERYAPFSDMIEVGKTAETENVIHLDWLEVNEPIGGSTSDITKTFYGASEGDVGSPGENPMLTASVVGDRDKFNTAEQNFRVAKAMNTLPKGLAHIYVGNHIEPFYKQGFPMSADSIASALGNTASHEAGHSLIGGGHLANVDGDSQIVASEQQAITLAGDRANGRFRLGFLGRFTDWLPANAGAETVRVALNALPTIRDSIPTGTLPDNGLPFLGATPDGYRVIFGGLLTWKDVPNLVVETGPNLTGVATELVKGRFSDRPIKGDGATTDVMVGGYLDTTDIQRFLPGETFERMLVALKGDWSDGDAQAALDQIARALKGTGLGGSGSGDPVTGESASLADPKLNVLNAGLKTTLTGLDFGTVSLDGPGGDAASRQVFLVNIGDPNLVVSNARIVGDASSFAITSSYTSSLARGTSTSLSITFDPRVGGSHKAKLVLDTNDPDGPRTITLEGVGISPSGDLQVSVANNNVGGQTVGAGAKVTSSFMTLTNIGAAPLTVRDVQVLQGQGIFSARGLPSGFGPGQPLVIQPGGSFAFDLGFTPDRAGLRPGLIDILTDDPDTPVFHQHVVGTGLTDGNFHPEQNYVAVRNPNNSGSIPLRTRTDDRGYWSVVLPARTAYGYTIFDPISGLVGTTGGISEADGEITDVGAPVFQASNAPDTDGDGLPDDVELAIGTSASRVDSNGDGIDDFAAVQRGLNPLGNRAYPTGIVANLNITGGVTDMKTAAPAGDASKLNAYVIGDAGFTVVDVSRFDRPIVLGQTQLDGSAGSLAVDPVNQVAVLVMSDNRVGIVDVSNPTRPAVRHIVTLPVAANLVEVYDGIAYLTSGGDLVVMDVVTGAIYESVPIGTHALTGLAREGSVLYTIDSARTLQVIDISGPKPVLRGALSLGFGNGPLFVGGSIAYVQEPTLGFGTVDVSNPDQPRIIAPPHLPDNIRFTGELAVNGSGLGGMAGFATVGTGVNPVFALLDVSDPTRTFNLLTSIPLTFATPTSVSIADGIGFVGTFTAAVFGAQNPGLLVINYRSFDAEGQAPTVSITAPVPDGTPITEGSRIPISVTANDDVQIARVELIVDGKVVATDVSFPFDFVAYAATLGSNATTTTIQVRATDTGGNVGLSNVLTYGLTPDTQAPSLAASVPADGAQVAAEAGIAVRFDEPIDGTLVNASGVTLTRDGVTVTLKSVKASSSQGISIETTSSLPFGAYTLTIDPSIIADRAGNHLSSPLVIHFIVGTARVVGTTPIPNSTVDTPVTSLSLDFNTAIDPAIPHASDFLLVEAGPDLDFNTADDISIPYSSLQFNTANTRLTLGLGQPLSPGSYLFTAPSAKLIDSFGRPLDGEFLTNTETVRAFPSGDGVPGGDFRMKFTKVRPSALKFDSLPTQLFPNFSTNSLPSLTLGTTFSPILSVDLNGDGLSDIVRTIQGRYFVGFDGRGQQVFANASQVGVLFGKPGGGFTAAAAFDVAPNATRVVAGDVNGDGKLDLVVLGNPGTSNSRKPFQFSVLLGTGTGFLPELRIDAGLDSNQPGAIVLGNFSGDGKLDLAVLIAGQVFANPDVPNRVAVFKGIGDGSFHAPTLTDLDGTASEYQLLTADVDRDGKLDLVSTSHVLENRGDGSFNVGPLGLAPLPQGSLFLPGNDFAQADVDGDGRADLINLVKSPDGIVPTFVQVSLAQPSGAFGTAINAATLPADFGDSLLVADVNGDGRADAVVWQRNPDGSGVNARLMMGKPDGTFTSAGILISGMPFLPDLGILDRNGDGKLDVISSVKSLLGDGTGSFTAGPLESGDTLVGLADVNNDRIPDAIMTARALNYDSSTGLPIVDSVGVRVLLGRGDGTFQAMSSEVLTPIDGDFGNDRTGRFITGAVADLDGDGKMDLVLSGAPSAATFQGGVAVLRGGGNGSFDNPKVFPLYDPFNRFQPVTVAVGDASGDGVPDLLVGLVNTNSGQPFSTGILVGVGDGTFLSPIQNPGPVAIDSLTVPARLVADVNNDGKLDLIRLSSDINQQASVTTLDVALGRGDGTFEPSADGTPSPLPKGFGTGFNLGDVNGDGKLDALVWQGFTDGGGVSARLVLGNGDGTFGAPTAVLNATNFIQYELADVDGDGKLDIVRLGAFGNLVVNRGDGLGGFGADIVSGQFQIGFSGTNFLLADVNGDGKLDAINPGNRAALGDGTGQFFAAPRPFTGIPAGSAALGDIDGDGKLDVIGTSPNQIRISRGLGDGSFGDAVTIPVENLDGLGEVVAKDLDGDGFVDLVVTGENVLTLLLGNGDGTFQSPIRLSAPGSTRARTLPYPSVRLLIADLNRDGLLDILAADTILLRKR